MQVTLDVKAIDTDQLVKIGRACAEEVSRRASVEHSFGQSLFATSAESPIAWKNPEKLKTVRAQPIVKAEEKKETSLPVIETDVYGHRFIKTCGAEKCTCRYYLKKDDDEFQSASIVDKFQLHVAGLDADKEWEENRKELQTVVQANTCHLFTGKGKFVTAEQRFPYIGVHGDTALYYAVFNAIDLGHRSFEWDGKTLHIALKPCMRIVKLKIIPNSSFGFITFASHADAARAQFFLDAESFSCNFVNKTIAAQK